MRKVKVVLILIVLLFLFTSCNRLGYKVYETEYDDKEISTILYSINNNWIPNWNEKLIDFENRTYSTRNTIKEDYKADYIDEYNEGLYSDNYLIVKSFSESELNAFNESIVEHGIYNLEEKYSEENVYDGSTWKLVITFADGTTFNSSGYVKIPIQANQIDLDCYQLLTDQIFGTLGREYFEPPALGLSVDYVFENGSSTLVTSADICSYEWRSFTKDEDVINLYQNDNLSTYKSDEFKNDDNLVNQKYVKVRFDVEEKCKKVKIYKMDLDGANKSLITSKRNINKYILTLEEDKIYIIDISFSDGNVEYAFAYEK